MAKFVLYKNEGKIYRLEAELPPSDAYTVFEFDTENQEDLIYDGYQIRLKTLDEKLAEEKQRKIEKLKRYAATLLEPPLIPFSDVFYLFDTDRVGYSKAQNRPSKKSTNPAHKPEHHTTSCHCPFSYFHARGSLSALSTSINS